MGGSLVRIGSRIRDYAPGVLLTVVLAALAMYLAETPLLKRQLLLSPLLLVILLGMVLKSLWHPPAAAHAGVAFAQKPVLRWGVALLGLKLSLGELASYGVGTLLVVVMSTVAAVWFGWWIGRRLGLPEKFALLLSVGGGICGASAIVAADSVVQGEKSDSAYSLGIITLLGTVGIVAYPALFHVLPLSELTYGVWAGASLHETAQVVAASAAVSELSKVTGTAVKLARICLLAPIVFYLSWQLRREHRAVGPVTVPLVPWFLVLFVVFAAIHSLRWMPPAVRDALLHLDLWLLCIGMAGVGLQAGFHDLRRAGLRPLLAGVAQWLFLALVSLGLIVLFRLQR
ncbi:MAG: YeiH family protein [Phycisphaerae bacterium]